MARKNFPVWKSIKQNTNDSMIKILIFCGICQFIMALFGYAEVHEPICVFIAIIFVIYMTVSIELKHEPTRIVCKNTCGYMAFVADEGITFDLSNAQHMTFNQAKETAKYMNKKEGSAHWKVV